MSLLLQGGAFTVLTNPCQSRWQVLHSIYESQHLRFTEPQHAVSVLERYLLLQKGNFIPEQHGEMQYEEISPPHLWCGLKRKVKGIIPK